MSNAAGVPGRAISGWSRAAPILALAFLYAVYALVHRPPSPILESDSFTYLNFAPFRSAGYPLFLRLFGADGAVIAQPLLYAAAVAYLGWETLAASRSILLACGLALAMMVNPEVNDFHFQIMTESLFTTLSMVLLGLAIRFACRPTWRVAAFASLLAGLAATVRPTGIALLPALVLMALMHRAQVRAALYKILIAAILPMLFVVAAERAYTKTVQGDRETSVAGQIFFAKAAMIEAPPEAASETDPVRRALSQVLEQDFAPVRSLLRAAPDADIRGILTLVYEICAEWVCIDPLRAKIGLPAPQMNEAFLHVGLARIAKAPLAYLVLTWTHYRDMWVFYSQSHPDLLPAFRAFIAAHRPLPVEALVPRLIADPAPNRFAVYVRPAMIAIGLATAALALVGLGLAWRGRSAPPAAAVAGLAALIVHGSILFTALFGVGIVRYSLSQWPAMMVALAFALAWALGRLRQGRKPT